MKNQKKGVSLIVLVITIIVIIILAAAVILSLNNNNPISNAKKATVQSDLKTYTDELSLYVANKYTETMGVFNPNEINAQAEAMNTYISSMQTKYYNIVEIQNGKLVVKDGVTGDEANWARDVLPEKSFLSGEVVQVGTAVGVNTTFDGKTRGTATNPIIPKGFAPINTPTSTWQSTADGSKKGLVIEDMTNDAETDGNQFVWIPVATEGEFIRTDEYKSTNSLTILQCGEDDTTGEYIAMKNSVVKNQGFYIARYEAGKPAGTLTTDGDVKPLSQASKPVWNSIPWGAGNNVTDPGNGAVIVARAMYPSANTNVGAVSTLIYGVQWDATLRYLVNNGASVELMKDSRTWGNHKDSLAPANVEGKFANLQQTGSQDVWSRNNICDFAGNVWEWTMETYRETHFVGRGGGYNDSKSGGLLSCRVYNTFSFARDDLGFRLALYIESN